ncbi:hypothetical protein DK871_26800 [Pseudomonas sp. L13]|nr:hypothetical protein [Pseudomonas sp. L13]
MTGWGFFCRSELAREKRNDNACSLNERGACKFFASKLAPTSIMQRRLSCDSPSPSPHTR